MSEEPPGPTLPPYPARPGSRAPPRASPPRGDPRLRAAGYSAPCAAGRTSLLRPGTEAAASEQNSIISLFLFPFVCSFKRIFRTALCRKSSLLFIPQLTEVFTFQTSRPTSRAGHFLSARAFRNPSGAWLNKGITRQRNAKTELRGVVLCLPASCTASPDASFYPQVSVFSSDRIRHYRNKFLAFIPNNLVYSQLFMQIV